METKYISPSTIVGYLLCARKQGFKLAKVEPERTPAALAFGSAVHGALEAVHIEMVEGTPDVAKAIEIFRADWAAQQENKLSFKDGEDATSMRDLGTELVRLYVERFGCSMRVRAAEVAFDLPLTDDGLVLRGYMDLIVEPDTIVEIKTAARRPTPDDLRRKLQLSAYAWAYRALRGRDPTVTVISLLKTKKPAIDVQTTVRTPEDDAWFVAAACEVSKAIAARAFPPNAGWLCSDCEYAKACAAWRGSTIELPGQVAEAA